MKIQLMTGLALAVALAGCSKKETTPATPATNAPMAGGNPITAPIDYLGAVAKAQKSAVKTVDTVSLNKAIELFNAQEERFPDDLNELVAKKYLQSVPAAPAGMKFEYDAKAGTVRIVKQ